MDRTSKRVKTSSIPAWQQLVEHVVQQLRNEVHLRDMFAVDSKRVEKFSLQHGDLLYDFSKQRITSNTLELLLNLAEEVNLQRAINDLFNGEHVNITENRPALHVELRKPGADTDVAAVLDQIAEFEDDIVDGGYTDVICLGIGGSDLGPRLVCEALQFYTKENAPNLHFISNVDPDTLARVIKNLNPETTITLVNSKSFTTLETLATARYIKAWYQQQQVNLDIANMYAVTMNSVAAAEFGIASANIFPIWDWVGGRFSVWSAVGLPIVLRCGMQIFREFLLGAAKLDEHFHTVNLERNIPVIMGLLGIWNINFHSLTSLAIMPYIDSLRLLPDYLQQLEMESNGKVAASDFSGEVQYPTAPIIWGGVGCNGQHSYMQLLHQGSQVVPVDFIVAAQSHTNNSELQDILVASCIGQSQALMLGRENPIPHDNHRNFKGNRPSSTLMFTKLTPFNMGKLLAIYEHKVYVQGVVWGIQSFDQWGVQLGKDTIKNIIAKNMDGNADSSSAQLLNYYKQHKQS